MMWSERYRPASIPDMVGNEESRSAVVEWFAKWKRGTKPLLLSGPPGTGKTTIAFLAAAEFGYDMVGLNASDVRSKSKINEILGPVMGNATVTGMPMIFIDEVDGIHGRGDYGGAAALAELLKEPTVPIILAANDEAASSMKAVLKVVKAVRFKKIPPRLLQAHLKEILKKEGAQLGPGSLIKVISRSRGDIRSMINLAQSLVTGFNPQTDSSAAGMRPDAGVEAFFKAESAADARDILQAMRGDPREKINAFYSSIVTSGLEPGVLAKCLDVISEADILYGRIIRSQNWRLLRYLNDILAGLYATGARVQYSQYNLPWPLLNRIRWDGAKLKALARYMAPRLHMSSSAFATFALPCMLACLKNGGLDDDLEEHKEILEKEAAR